MVSGFSASADSAHTNQQLPTEPCRMSSGLGSPRNTTQGTEENWRVVSSTIPWGGVAEARSHPMGRTANSIARCGVPQC
jgi:hypothetical protein